MKFLSSNLINLMCFSVVRLAIILLFTTQLSVVAQVPDFLDLIKVYSNNKFGYSLVATVNVYLRCAPTAHLNSYDAKNACFKNPVAPFLLP